VDVLGVFLRQLAERTESKLDDQLVPLLIKSLKILVGILAAVTIIQRLGYSIGAILGTLAIGGLAISLAAQDTLKNFFGSVFIFLDRPFQIGDWVTCGDADGVIEEVGFRSTKIRTFKNTLITVPNSRIADTAIENHTRMQKRRIYIQIGVTYSTTASQMETLVKGIKQILIEHPGIRQDFHMVKFTDFADSSLSVMVYCFTNTTAWEEHLAVREEVFLSIMRLVERLGLSFAFPSRSLYIEKWPDAGTSPAAGTSGGGGGGGGAISPRSAPPLSPPVAD
jgi:MscS family membrane protein